MQAALRALVGLGRLSVPKNQPELAQAYDVEMEVDPVAYVRFASVYRNFREAKDFEDFIGSLGETA